MPYTSTDQALPQRLPKFYECGICAAWHSLAWDGDCRENAARFFAEELDATYGMTGWEAVPMPGGEES